MSISREVITQKNNLMGELKSLLLATDCSPHSEGAVKEAILFAKSCSIKLTLLYIRGLSEGYESGGLTAMEKMDPKILSYFNAVRETAAEENVELDIVIRRTDEAFQGIIKEAEERKTDVIIMGRRGMSGFQRILMGSVTAKVIAYAPCKVLVVPKDADVRGEKILLATDGSKYSEMAEIESINIAKRCPHVKNFTAVSVAPSKDNIEQANKILNRLNASASKEGVSVDTLALVGEPYKTIVNASLETSADIVIIGTHGRTGLSRFFMGSVAERVIALCHCSVLVVKP
jgi:nucleotide-binding universal stress UspA family protein